MKNHGFDQPKLQRNLDALLAGWIQSGHLPCAQAIVSRRGETVYQGTFGHLDAAGTVPLPEDAIFRAYSMTKTFTSACMLMLLEEGKFKMHDPLSRFFPEFKDIKVTETAPNGGLSLVKPRREIVIRDLFTMASGIPYPGGETPSERAMQAMLKRMDRDVKAGKPWDARRVMREIGSTVPLTFHPGEHWWYGESIDVLGALVEHFSGMRLGDYMARRIFEPLGLTDTAFYVPEEKRDRFVELCAPDARGVYHKDTGAWFNEAYHADPPFQTGGGGLVSTAKDLIKWTRLLAGLGEVDGVRLLSRSTVELMRRNHLSEQQMADYNWDTQRGYGYGLAVRTMLRPELAGYGNVGEFGWDGMAGTWLSADPAEEMAMVFLVQVNPGKHYETVPYFAQTVYGAIGD